MKKKLIGLSTLLLVLLLGLFTTCYADVNRTWTEDEVKNLLYNYYVNLNNKSENDTLTFIENNDSNIQTLVTFLNTQSMIVIYINNNYGLTFLGTRSTNKAYFTGNQVHFNTSYTDSRGYYFKSDFTYNNRKLNDFSSYSANMSYYYTNTPLYDNSNNVVYAVGFYPSTFFDEWYWTSAPDFSFVPEEGLGTVTYNNYDYNLYESPSSGDLLLGTLYIPNGIVVNYLDIINFYWRWNNWQERELSSEFINLRLLSSEDGNLSFAVYLKSDNIYDNTYYQYIWTSTQTEPYEFVSGGCYIKDSHTVIVNGVVDPYLTFSGDYSDEYNNNLELQDLKDTMQDQTDQLLDDSEVDDMLSGFNTSGDILDSLGYSPIENPFTTVILDVIGQLTDVLLGSGNVTLDISAFDLDMILNSSDFTLPNGLIKNFVSLVSNGFLIWIIYKYGFKIYMMINTGKFKNLINETTNTDISLF